MQDEERAARDAERWREDQNEKGGVGQVEARRGRALKVEGVEAETKPREKEEKRKG